MKTNNPSVKAKLMLLILCFACLFVSPSCSSDDDNTDPSSQENDNDENGFNHSVFVLDTKDLIPVGTPVVDADDHVYMAFVDDLMLDAQSTIICISSDNAGKWEINIDEPVTSLVLTGNNVIATSYEKLYAINTTDGNVAWTYQLTKPNSVTNTKINHKPCIDNHGNIIVAMDSYLEEVLKVDAIPARVISLSASGNFNWEHVLSTGDLYNDRYSKLCSPVSIDDKTFVTWYYQDGAEDYTDLIAINNMGDIVNNKTFDVYINTRILCADDNGQIYLYGAIDLAGGEIQLLANDFSFKWKRILDDRLTIGNVLLDESLNIYYNCEDGKMYKVDKNSNEVWSFEYGKIFVRGDLILADDGNIYKMGQGLAKINPETGKDETIEFGSSLSAGHLSMRDNGELVVSSMLDKVYFVRTKSEGLDKKAAWPKAGKDYFNSSSIK